jgi:hypothetical protein
VAYFPAVPRRRAGMRVVLNAHQRLEDISSLVHDIASCSGASRNLGSSMPALRAAYQPPAAE